MHGLARSFVVVVTAFFVSVLVSLESAAAQLFESCGADVVESVEYKWCADWAGMSADSDVILYFHGANGSEREWLDHPTFQLLKGEMDRVGGPRPAVISISFGPFWLFKDFVVGTDPHFYQLYMQRILPRILSMLPFRGDEKVLLGASMGGYNAFQVFARHSADFARGAFLCPAFSSLSPFATEEEFNAYLARQPYALDWLVRFALDRSRYEFPTVPDFERHDPLRIAQAFGTRTRSMFAACGNRDEFGFIEGARVFADTAISRRAPLIWRELEGAGHCQNMDAIVPELAKFLAGKLQPPLASSSVR